MYSNWYIACQTLNSVCTCDMTASPYQRGLAQFWCHIVVAHSAHVGTVPQCHPMSLVLAERQDRNWSITLEPDDTTNVRSKFRYRRLSCLTYF